jgi:SNF2 family DNA or RNA helicase
LENRPEDLAALFAFLEPGLIQAGSSRNHIHERIQPYFLRRTKRDVLPDLPPIIDQEVTLDLHGAQKAAYDELWYSRHAVAAGGDQEARGSLLALITHLKQLCNREPVSGESVKLNALRVIAENLSGSEAKLLVFSQYVETLSWLSRELTGVPTQLFHGGLTTLERDSVVQRFQEAPGPQVLLMSIRAGGVGLNLQAATTVVLFDRWWNPAVEDQAVQRAHRFGREVPLHVFKFLVRDTIEERIDELLREKSDLFTEYVEEAESALPVMTGGHLWRLLDITSGGLSDELRQRQGIEEATSEREGG